MTKIEHTAKAVSIAVAQVRVTLKEPFVLKELEKQLAKNKCPYARFIVPFLRQNEIIIKVGDEYQFASSEPVHYKTLEPAILYSQDTIREYMARFAAKKKQQIIVNTVSEEQMIAYLKEKGYKILKPRVDYDEI